MTKDLRVFVMVGGARVAVVLTLDSSATVINERVDAVKLDQAALGSHTNNNAVRRWFLEDASGGENTIEGSEDLRAAFFREKEQQAANSGGICTGCRLANIINKYSKLLEENGLLKNIAAG
jgi:hypothetical protein